MNAPSPPALVALTEGGAVTARRLLSLWEGAELHGLEGRVGEAHRHFSGVMECLPALFLRRRPIVAFCAAGIVIRALAPVLREKRDEPPVLSVSEDGRHVVPLLGGHRGGLAMAHDIAAHLGGAVASTGGGENRFGVLLDAPPPGHVLANPGDYPAFIAALLEQGSVSLECTDGIAPPEWLLQSRLPWREDASLRIHVGVKECAGGPACLVYHPRSLLLGIGCERGAGEEDISAVAQAALEREGLARDSIAAVVSVEAKLDEPGLIRFAERWGAPLRFFSAARLEEETPRLPNPSEAVFAAVGCHGVCEAAALAGAGSGGELRVAKIKNARATCAIAQAAAPVDGKNIGRGRGSLAVVGLGPGGAAWRTWEVEQALAAASDIVGYEFYFSFLPPLSADTRTHGFALGEERERARHALRLASEGRQVALVSSGDAGIYGMASPLLEEMEGGDWRGFSLRFLPGLSAMQLAAARGGALLGHDFAAVSLSDLLTPWEAIETRLLAALRADFVIALYNPASKRREHLLERALKLTRTHRAAETPVVLARNLGREGESVRILSLAEIHAEEVDMCSILLVGSSQSRRCGAWAYTPRGYASKEEAKP